MNNKRLGAVLIAFSLVLGGLFLSFINAFNNQAVQNNCYANPNCSQIASNLNITHLAVGIIASILSLGFYMLFFNKEHLILKKLQEEKNIKINDEKFSIISSVFDDNEKSILTIVKNQPGITQNTLRLKANLSKSKISSVLSEFEKRSLVKREAKGKTYSIFITKQF